MGKRNYPIWWKETKMSKRKYEFKVEGIVPPKKKENL
jgi:hypothetical protein